MLLTLRQVNWIKCIVKSGKLTEKIRNTFLQNRKPVVKEAVAEASESEGDDSRGDKESSDGESGNEESGDEKSGHEESSDEVVEEVEAMTVEQGIEMIFFNNINFGQMCFMYENELQIALNV